MYSRVKKDIESENKVVILTHSQGNLFANRFCKQAEKVDERKRIKIEAVKPRY